MKIPETELEAMVEPMYKYHIKIGNKIVHCGIAEDLD
jgi:hypothetical protein